MNLDVLAAEAAPETWRQALECTFTMLREPGYVKDTYLQSCAERETSYPTGLAFSRPVAIPHTDPIHVNKAAICLLRLQKPVAFGSMEEPGESVLVELVINLALESSEGQLGMLRSIMKILRDEAWLTAARTMPLEELRTQFAQRVGAL